MLQRLPSETVQEKCFTPLRHWISSMGVPHRNQCQSTCEIMWIFQLGDRAGHSQPWASHPESQAPVSDRLGQRSDTKVRSQRAVVHCWASSVGPSNWPWNVHVAAFTTTLRDSAMRLAWDLPVVGVYTPSLLSASMSCLKCGWIEIHRKPHSSPKMTIHDTNLFWELSRQHSNIPKLLWSKADSEHIHGARSWVGEHRLCCSQFAY